LSNITLMGKWLCLFRLPTIELNVCGAAADPPLCAECSEPIRDTLEADELRRASRAITITQTWMKLLGRTTINFIDTKGQERPRCELGATTDLSLQP
jgi:hypothetical protein